MLTVQANNMLGELKVCNNKTRFYQGKMSHFEKHLGDYINVILSLQQKPMEKYEKYISSIKTSVTSLVKMKSTMISRLSKCNSYAGNEEDVQHLHFHYGTNQAGSDNPVNIDKIKSIINSTG